MVVGGGPAGLMAADVISAAGVAVTLVERMPSLGRKLLMAGRGGLNLTHTEPLPAFLGRYGPAEAWLRPMVEAFPPSALVSYAEILGQPTFTGSSGRVFPKAMKSSPLLRAIAGRLTGRGVNILTRHRWLGLAPDGSVEVSDAQGRSVRLSADAVVLALGGASWPRLGSDGSWLPMATGWGVGVTPLTPANAGVVIGWSEHFAERFAGTPLKRVRVVAGDGHAGVGDVMVTRTGLEGGPIYAVSRSVGAALAGMGSARLEIDLKRDLDGPSLARKLAEPRGKQSTSTWLRKSTSLPPVAIALLREVFGSALPPSPDGLASAIKRLPLTVTGFSGLDRAISTAGGIRRDEVDAGLMLIKRPGVFVAGEMLDWDAPTGGYLLQACFATGHHAGKSAVRFLEGGGTLDDHQSADHPSQPSQLIPEEP